MRGLRPEEAEVLRNLAARNGRTISRSREPEAIILRHDLVEQGRLKYTIAIGDPDKFGTWTITPAGREALRLWPLMQALAAAGTP